MQDDIEIEIEITKLFGDKLNKAVVHPYTASESCEIQCATAKNGKFLKASLSSVLRLRTPNFMCGHCPKPN